MPDVVYEYYASQSELIPKTIHSLDQHQSSFYELNGADWNATLEQQKYWFYATKNPEGDSGSLSANIRLYFAAYPLGLYPSEWIDLVELEALGTAPTIDGLTPEAYDFVTYVNSKQEFFVQNIYIQETQPDSSVGYAWINPDDVDAAVGVFYLSDGA